MNKYIRFKICIGETNHVVFKIELKCHVDKYPYVPRNCYHTADEEFDLSWWGAAGDEFPYNLNHVYVKGSGNRNDHSLFTQTNETITCNERRGDEKYIEIQRKNAGYWIIANAILNQDWEWLRALFGRFIPSSQETMDKNPGWDVLLPKKMKEAFVMRAHDTVKTIFLHIHSLAPKVWNCKKQCPNMQFDQLWKVFKKKNKNNWFYYNCFITEYSIHYGNFNGTQFSIVQFVKTVFVYILCFLI